MLATVRIEAQPQTGPIWWLPLGLAIAGLASASLALGRSRSAPPGPLPRRIAGALAAHVGLPSWAAAGSALAMWSLGVAFVGFVWDVAWHADLGRDTELFTPPHTMILVGLVGIGGAAVVAVVLATLEHAETGLSLGRLRVPRSAVPLGLLGLGAMIGFPLDDWWHRQYGIDVTMWSPTHLLMIGGASLAPIAIWLMVAEGDTAAPSPRRTRARRLLSQQLAGATVVGLSTFQLEFDLGIPQWQALYHPVLIALAMGLGLVAAREALGKWGALDATIRFLVARAAIAGLVGGPFGLSVPRFPLYLGGALCVELAYLLGEQEARASLVRPMIAGLGIGTVGMAVEWGWTHLWGLQPWQPRLLPSWWVVVAMAVAGAIVGSALGRVVAHRPQPLRQVAVPLALAAFAALLVVPLPRHGSDAVATVTAAPVGPPVAAIGRDGRATIEQDVRVAVRVQPPQAAQGADVFRVVAWQGGALVIRTLRQTGPATYLADGPIPTGGSWKSLVFLADGDVVAAVPVSFPADKEYGLPAIATPITTARVQPFVAASRYLTRESHAGGFLAAVVAYSAFGAVVAIWCVAFVAVGGGLRRQLRLTSPSPALVGAT